jgi:hypothetical protein
VSRKKFPFIVVQEGFRQEEVDVPSVQQLAEFVMAAEAPSSGGCSMITGLKVGRFINTELEVMVPFAVGVTR